MKPRFASENVNSRLRRAVVGTLSSRHLRQPEMGLGAERSTIMGEQLVGTVTHYFGKPHVAIVEVTAGELRVGDTIRVAGAHSDFTQHVASMELEHEPVDAAKVGDSVGIQVSERAREHDQVYRVTTD
jgi:translation elongation factor EF-1alpha